MTQFLKHANSILARAKDLAILLRDWSTTIERRRIENKIREQKLLREQLKTLASAGVSQEERKTFAKRQILGLPGPAEPHVQVTVTKIEGPSGAKLLPPPSSGRH